MLVLALILGKITTLCVVLMYGCYGGIMGSFPSLASSIFGMEHSGENYGYIMFGMAAATLGAPALSGLMQGYGFDIRAVFVMGAVSAVLAFVSMLLLERDFRKESRREMSC